MQSIRLATCLDRNVAASGAIAATVSPCLPWRKHLALAERLPPAEHPGAGRAAPASGGPSGRSEPSKGLEPFRRPPAAGLGERSKAISEALRTVARHGPGKQRSSDKAGAGRRSWRARSVPPGGLGRPRGPSSQARVHGGRWCGFGAESVHRRCLKNDRNPRRRRYSIAKAKRAPTESNTIKACHPETVKTSDALRPISNFRC